MKSIFPSSHKLSLYVDVFTGTLACLSLSLEFVDAESRQLPGLALLIQHRFILSIIFTAEWVYHILKASRKIVYVFSSEGLVDLLTSLPVLLLELFPHVGALHNVYILLLATRSLKLKGMESHLRNSALKRAFETFRFIFSLIYISAAAISIIENMSFIKSFYFLVMSITTVGYGDVSLVSGPASVLNVVLILW